MLCHYILTFKAGEKALAALSQGTHGLSWESVAGQEHWSPWRRQSILSSQRRRLWHPCCPPSEIHLLALETLCLHFFSQKAEDWHWSFCHPCRPIARTGSSSCALTANVCPISRAPCKPALPVRAVGQVTTEKIGPWAMENEERLLMLWNNHPQLFGELIVGSPWITADVLVQWCLCRRMFGNPQGMFVPADVWDSIRNIWSLSSQPGWLRVCLEYLHCKVPD